MTITAQLGTSGQTTSNGQTMWLRYTTDPTFTATNSTVLAMANTSGTNVYTANIPKTVGTNGQTVRYYVFSSGSSTNNPALATPSSADADLRTITFNNNGGSNFSYVVAAPLPVTYTSWLGERRGGEAQLEWTTGSEEDAELFEVQRSVDGGRNWSSVGEVAAMNRSTGADYEFTDYGVPGTELQYRLKQIDFDGAFHFSDIITIAAADNAQALSVWPQPAPVGAIQLRAAGFAGHTASLYSITGRMLVTFPLTGEVQPLPAADLPKGIYLLRINGERGLTQRILID
ncbi:T9SS type A sorting domain-containing protein [Neolewinella litorea]|uniref:T9SS type A sorting domain-containing protein n=1 Tax=Neolewinella litorea TaxID=2562452 RepID=UPI001455E19A|nr:T9SS type A sorting domain-containing protein [Neolewinella litorea]